jgi:hypothetical protein
MMVAWHEMPGTRISQSPSRRVRCDGFEDFASFCTVNQFWGRPSDRSLRDGSFPRLSRAFHAWLPSFNPFGTIQRG